MGLDNAGKTSVIMDMERGEEQHSAEPASHGGSGFTRRTKELQPPFWGGVRGTGRVWLGQEGHTARGCSSASSAPSPHAALAGEVLPDAQPGRSRLRVERFEVTLLELPGALRSRSAWRSHYSEAHGLLFVLDSQDLARMEEARKVLSRILSHPDVSGKPLLL
ncbi:hypothetical protein Nmel_012915 [Mimus melanotis]